MSSHNVPADEEIASMKESVRLAASRARKNNWLLPVYSLIPEILEIIFIHGARSYYEEGSAACVSPFPISIPGTRDYCEQGSAARVSPLPGWVNVSYVCSHWRNIALNCPALWTHHFTVSLRWTEELLLRSKLAPLKISCIYPYSDPKKTSSLWLGLADNLLKHSGRIQELSLDVPSEFFPPEFVLCAPWLEKLDIEHPQIPEWSLAITGGDTPVLRTLRLVNCPLPWFSFNLSRLNTLSLCRTPFHLGIAEFLALLKTMRDLTSLSLEYVLPSSRGFLSSSGLVVSSVRIALPRLALLTVAAPVSTVNALLFNVDIPLKTQLNLVPQFERGSSVSDYAPITSFLAQRFSMSEQLSSPCPLFRSLEIYFDYVGTQSTLSSSERCCITYSQLEYSSFDVPQLMIALGEDSRMAANDRHCILRDICCSLPLTSVQTLRVFGPEFLFSSNVWKEILGRLDGLRYMELSDGYMPDLSALFLEAQDNPGGTSSHMFVPALEELVLSYIVFIPDNAPPQGSSRISERLFFDTLSTRKGLRDRLKMIECDVDSE